MIKTLIGLGLILLLNGCQTVFKPWLLSELAPGMNADQVKEKLGDPVSIESREAATVFVYSYTEPLKLQTEFPNWEKQPLPHSSLQPDISIEQHHYELIFIDNSLINYKERH
jgi:hypothetical protein